MHQHPLPSAVVEQFCENEQLWPLGGSWRLWAQQACWINAEFSSLSHVTTAITGERTYILVFIQNNTSPLQTDVQHLANERICQTAFFSWIIRYKSKNWEDIPWFSTYRSNIQRLWDTCYCFYLYIHLQPRPVPSTGKTKPSIKAAELSFELDEWSNCYLLQQETDFLCFNWNLGFKIVSQCWIPALLATKSVKDWKTHFHKDWKTHFQNYTKLCH